MGVLKLFLSFLVIPQTHKAHNMLALMFDTRFKGLGLNISNMLARKKLFKLEMIMTFKYCSRFWFVHTRLLTQQMQVKGMRVVPHPKVPNVLLCMMLWIRMRI